MPKALEVPSSTRRQPAELVELIKLRTQHERLKADYANLEARYRSVCANELPKVVLDLTDGHSGPGWYFWDSEYPEEGSTGAYTSVQQAAVDIKQIDCDVEIDSVVALAKHCDDQGEVIQAMKGAIAALVEAADPVELSTDPQSEDLEAAIREARRFLT